MASLSLEWQIRRMPFGKGVGEKVELLSEPN